MKDEKAEKSFGELPTLGHEEPQKPGRNTAPEGPSWTEPGLSEAATLRPEGRIVDDGRTDAARRWRAGEAILGRYVVEGELGQGGMGVVYGCLDKVGGVKVAVKCLPPELGHNSVEMEEVRENFQMVCGLAHPNIAVVRQLERDEKGEYYLVMELAEGESLRRWLRAKWKTGGVSLAEAVGVLRQVASALDYAHGEKIVHRDVKPGNVMIDGKGRVKVLDFGLAAQIRTSLSRASQAYRGTSGTGPYMAPEQWQAQPQDAKTDQYALGVMAYEMLAGRLPFENPELAVLKVAVLNGEVAGIQGVPETVMAAIRRAMGKRAEERFGSCGEFVEALEGGGVGGRRSASRQTVMGWRVALALLAGVIGAGLWWNGQEKETVDGPPTPPLATQATPEEAVQRNVAQEVEKTRPVERKATKNEAEASIAVSRADSAQRLVKSAEKYARKKMWEKCLNAAEAALDAEEGNEDAQRLKEEAESNLKPSIVLKATVGGREVKAMVTEGGQDTGQTTPMTVGLLSTGSYAFSLAYETDGKKYAGQTNVMANTRGVTEAVVALQEVREAQMGENFLLDLGSGVSLEMVCCLGIAIDFWIGKYEVTQEQWQQVMDKNPSHFGNKPKNPVENVSWYDCQEFVKRVNALPAASASGLLFRLPTEEEWETACRARAPKSEDYCKLADGTQITEKTLSRVAWYGGDSKKDSTHPVGQKEPNAWGLYDMHGNVWEWTQTALGGDWVLRGGGFYFRASFCTAGFRCWDLPGNTHEDLGLRLVATRRGSNR